MENMANIAKEPLILRTLSTHGMTCFSIVPNYEGPHVVVRVFNLTNTEVSFNHFPPCAHIDNCDHKIQTPAQWAMILPSLMEQSEMYDADHHIYLCVTDSPVDEEVIRRARAMEYDKHHVDFVLASELSDDKEYVVLSCGLFVPYPKSDHIRIYAYGSYKPMCLDAISYRGGILYPSFKVTSHTRVTIVVVNTEDLDDSDYKELGFIGQGVLVGVPAIRAPRAMSTLAHKIWYPVLLELLVGMEKEVKGDHDTLTAEDYAIVSSLSTKGKTLLHVEHYKPIDDRIRRNAQEFREFILSLQFDGKAESDFNNFSHKTCFMSRVRNLFDMPPPSTGLYRQISTGLY